jgi:hypothetical protein
MGDLPGLAAVSLPTDDFTPGNSAGDEAATQARHCAPATAAESRIWKSIWGRRAKQRVQLSAQPDAQGARARVRDCAH